MKRHRGHLHLHELQIIHNLNDIALKAIAIDFLTRSHCASLFKYYQLHIVPIK